MLPSPLGGEVDPANLIFPPRLAGRSTWPAERARSGGDAQLSVVAGRITRRAGGLPSPPGGEVGPARGAGPAGWGDPTAHVAQAVYK